MTEYVLTLSCADRPGIVAAVSGLLARRGGNIVESQQYGDRVTGRFFMRVQFTVPEPAEADKASGASTSRGTGEAARAAEASEGSGASRAFVASGAAGVIGVTGVSGVHGASEAARTAGAAPGVSGGPGSLRGELGALAADLGLDWELWATTVRPRALILVSRAGHCLNDLLHRQSSGQLDIDIPAVVSNHPDLRPLTQSHGIDYHHLPVTPETRAWQEAEILTLVGHYRIDFVVLARYMQVLSDDWCAKLAGRVINIHHSFLPSFKGSRPYHQAHARGVKLIGATAHYVTGDLDEGPIIEQEVARVDHTHGPAELMATGRDAECLALARAVRWHAAHRVLLNGDKTVVFR